MKAQILHEEIIEPATRDNPRNSEASAIELKDGRLLLAWSDFYAGSSDFSPARISARHSEDGGRIWGQNFTLVENTAVMNTFNPSFLRLGSGGLALFFFRQEVVDDVKQYIRKSHDEGRTWGEERCITPERVRQFMHNDKALLTSTGHVVLPFAWTHTHADGLHSYRSVCWRSDDEGTTWHRGRGEIQLPKRGAMEPMAVERLDGSLLMLIRTQLGHLYQATSYDGGDTWTEALPMLQLVGSESPAAIKRIPDTGDLLIIWNHVFDPHRKHWGRTPLSAAISRDDGETWENFRDLETNPDYRFAYPSILFRRREVFLTYYRAGLREETSGRELKVKILPLDWFYEQDA